MKIGLCGTMSVGKTTLVNALQELDYFKDYTTRIERSKELMAMGIPLNTDSTFLGQTVFMAERASELLIDNIITDRTIIDVMSFALASKSMDWPDKDAFNEYARRLMNMITYFMFHLKVLRLKIMGFVKQMLITEMKLIPLLELSSVEKNTALKITVYL